jgi:small multidrug resistance family-3 protein
MTRLVLQHLIAILLFVVAAFLEVHGDAKIRGGIDSWRLTSCLIGAISLVIYGLFVNLAIAFKLIDWKFSKQLGVYVAIFAVVTSVYGVRRLNEHIGTLHWIGLSIVMAGGIVIALSKN